MEKQKKIKLAKAGNIIFGVISIIGVIVFAYTYGANFFNKAPSAKVLTEGLTLLGSLGVAILFFIFKDMTKDVLEKLEKAT